MQWWKLKNVLVVANRTSIDIEEIRNQARREISSVIESALNQIPADKNLPIVFYKRKTASIEEWLGFPSDCTVIFERNYYHFTRQENHVERKPLPYSFCRKIKFHSLYPHNDVYTKKFVICPYLGDPIKQQRGIAWHVPYLEELQFRSNELMRGRNVLEVLSGLESGNEIRITITRRKVCPKMENILKFYISYLTEEKSKIYKEIIEEGFYYDVSIQSTSILLMYAFAQDILEQNLDVLCLSENASELTFPNHVRKTLGDIRNIFSRNEAINLVSPTISFGERRILEENRIPVRNSINE